RWSSLFASLSGSPSTESSLPPYRSTTSAAASCIRCARSTMPTDPPPAAMSISVAGRAARIRSGVTPTFFSSARKADSRFASVARYATFSQRMSANAVLAGGGLIGPYCARLADELDATGTVAVVVAPEIVGAQEKEDAAARLRPDPRGLVGGGRASEEELAPAAARRGDDDPALALL